jgi:hypothetical protein
MQDANNIPDNLRVGGGASASTMHPAVLAMVLISLVLMWVLPRKYVVVPFLLTIFLTPFGEQIYVAGLHIFATRMLIAGGLIRVCVVGRKLSKTSVVAGGLTPIDKAFILWALFRAAATVLEFLDKASVINQSAFIIDSIGGYLLLRCLIRDQEDILLVIKTLAFVTVVLALCMVNERVHNVNVFGYIGGRLNPFWRDGAIRSQGTFSGPIVAGTFGATVLCLFVWLLWSGTSRFIGLAAVIGSIVVVAMSASSTPMLALLGAILAILFWPLRRNMRTIRWGLVILLVSLHVVMKAPVWMLINHVDVIAGSSGYHRAMIIDQCVRHFGDWWLIGVKSSKDWGWDMWDQANQFVADAENGGLATLVCSILILSRCFGRLGTARRLSGGKRNKESLFWLLGATLFSYIVAFFGLSFTDQLAFSWYALLAMICISTSPSFVRKATVGSQVRIPVGVPQVGWSLPVPSGAQGQTDWLVRPRVPTSEI